jgi:hypothetical protein
MEHIEENFYSFRNLVLHGKTTKPFYKNLMPHDWYFKSNPIEGFMYIDELWGINSTESYKIYAPEYPIPTSSDEICEDGYLDYFRVICPEKEIDCANITHLKIGYIDRGIGSFKTFGNMLKSLFPKLKSLDFSQNYSYHPLARKNNNDQNVCKFEYDDFLFMLKILQLDNFRLDDCQSDFFKFLVIDDIFEVMPENSLFVLKHHNSFSDEVKEMINNKLKKYYEKRVSKEIYIYC